MLAAYTAYDNVSERGRNSLLNNIMASNSAEYKLDIGNKSSHRTHDDLIRTCTYREILSTEVVFLRLLDAITKGSVSYIQIC